MLLTKDRIKELTTTSGTGTLTLSGTAEQGFQAFSVLGNGTKCYYTITDVNGTDFEVGLGTYSSNTLTRDTILESSNSGNAISLSATGSTVFVTYPAEKSSYRDIGVNRDYVASGTITAGKPLILNTDNTVTQVAETSTTASTPSQSSNYKFDYASFSYDVSVAYDTVNDKIGVAGRNYNNYLSLTIGSQSGTTVTWGTPVIVKSSSVGSANSSYRLAYGNGVFVATYVVNGEALLKAGEVSGTNSITLGSEYRPNTDTPAGTRTSISYNENAGKFIFAFSVNSSTSVKAWILSNSGSTLSVASSTPDLTITNAGNNYNIFANIYDPDTNKTIIGVDGYSDDTGRIYALTISGSSLTAGTPYSMTGPYYEDGSSNLIYDTNNNKFLLLQAPNVAGTYTIQGTVLTASGTTFTGGTKTQLSTDKARYITSFFDTSANKIVVAYQLYESTYYGKLAEVTISGTTPSWTGLSDTILNQTAERVYPKSALFNPDTNNGLLVGTFDMSADDGMAVVVYYLTTTSSNLTTDNYFGVASSTASDTESVGVNRAGSFNNDQTGLTAGKDYYAKDDGTIIERTTTTTTPDTNPTISTITKQTGSTYSYWDNSIAYESTSGYYVRGRRDGSTNYPVVESGTWGSLSTGITWNTPTVLSSNSLRGQRIRVATGGGYAHCSYCTRENSNENAKVTPVAISGSGGLTLGTTTTVNTLATSGSSTQPTSIVYDTSQNTILAFFDLGWQAGYIHKVFPLQMSGANYSYSSSDAVTFASGIDMSAKSTNAIYDPDTNRTVFFYILDAGTKTVNGIVFSCSGTTITQGSTQTASFTGTPNSGGYLTLAYDTQNNKIIIMYDVNLGAPSYTTYLPKYSIVTVTGGGTNTLSYTADAYAFSDTTQRTQVVSLAWNGDANKLFMVYGAYGDSHTQCDTFTSNGSTLTSTSSEELTTDAMVDSGGNETNASVFVTGQGVSYSLGSGSPGIMNFTLSLGSTTSTTVNASQFVGTARSGTDLELAEPPTELVGLANGSITKGKPVILRTDGDFEQVKSTNSSGSFSKGTETSLNGSSSDRYGFLNYNILRDKFLFQVRDNSSSTLVGMAVTVSDNTITVGTSSSSPLTSISSSPLGNTSYFDESTNYHAVFGKNSGDLEGVTAQITSSGTVTWGSKNTMHYTVFDQMCSNYVNDDNVGLIFYTRSGETKARSITTTGGTITDVSSVNIDSNSSLEGMSCAYSTKDNKTVLVRQDNGSSNYLSYSVVTSSGTGTTLSTSTPTIFISASDKVSNQALGYDITNDKFLLVYRQNANNKLTLRVGTLSGTTVTWGSATTLSGDPVTTAFDQALSYNKYASKFIVNYVDDSNSMYTTAFEVTLDSSGTITVENKTVLYSYWGYDNSSASSTISAQNIISTYNSSNYSKGIGVSSSYSVDTPNLTANNFIGFAQNTVADNEDIKVATTGQTDDNQSSLTTVSQYYVQKDGTLSTTADTPSVLGGTALTSTKILIKS